jgi:hypothetical protein
MQHLQTDVLVVGGGTGGTAAAIQAARRGVQVMLVSEFSWLGGMLTSAGVCAPDGNELQAFQTGLWGAFLRELRRRQPEGLDHGWVSFFTYHPRVGAEIFADWVAALPNLKWIAGQVPLEVVREGDRLTSVRFANYTITASIILDGTELGDLLALGTVPHRWGWEWQAELDEPSAPLKSNPLTTTYPVQIPTWVVMLRDFGDGAEAPAIPAPERVDLDALEGAWDGYGADTFLNYGRLPGDRFMINWPQHGNDYGHDLNRLIASPTQRMAVFAEALDYSLGFAHVVQERLGRRYGLATDMFPTIPNTLGGGAFALHPYVRESRRVKGLVTVREQDILPRANGQAALLPVDTTGRCEAIALGNYPNDHHYPAPESSHLTLTPKAMQWGGRWTGTPFSLPYRCLIPEAADGMLMCEKNISVSHIANGATRLQPVVLGIGQAAGMAAALCVEQQCQPRELSVRVLQEALLTEAIAPQAIIPLLNSPASHPDWLQHQRTYLDYPNSYPLDGTVPGLLPQHPLVKSKLSLMHGQDSQQFTGIFQRHGHQNYTLTIQQSNAETEPANFSKDITVVTLHHSMDALLKSLVSGCKITVLGRINISGNWIVADWIQLKD